MADSALDKKIKLANTKKKFKKLQDLKKKREETDHTDLNNAASEQEERNTPKSQVTDDNSRTFNISNINNENNINNLQQFVTNENLNMPSNAPSVANYFSVNSEKASTFFDNFSQSNTVLADLSLSKYFNSNAEKLPAKDNADVGNFLENNRNSVSNITVESSPKKYALFPNQNDSNFGNNSLKLASNKNDVNIFNKVEELAAIGSEAASEDYRKNLENVYSSSGPTENLLRGLSPNRDSPMHVNSSAIHREIDNFTDITKREISNVENLKQFAEQLAQNQPKQSNDSSSITDLEKRNAELLSELEKEKIQTNQLQIINSQLQNRLLEFEEQQKQKENELNLKFTQDLGTVKNELQAHLQTIGLLIAEKTALASNLNQYEMNFKQKNAECEELNTRLRASRSRVADLEREINTMKTDKDKSEINDEQHLTVINNLKKEYSVLKDQKDELVQDLLEVREKLKNCGEENIKLQTVNKDLTSKLSLADVKIQQLSSEGGSLVNNKIEELMQSILSLQKDKNDLNFRLESVIKEKEESTVQYQQYAQQLNQQMAKLSKELNDLQQSKDTLLLQEQHRIKHITELEKQLQNRKNLESNSCSETVMEGSKLQALEEEYKKTQLTLKNLENSFSAVTHNNQILSTELIAKTDTITKLESLVQQLKENQPDSVKLLQAMESDKIAASKAIQQNKELKEQLESLQEVFRKMDDDKVQLTENYHAQQQTNKELVEQLKKMEHNIQSLTDAIDIKDKELSRLMEVNSKEENVQNLHHHQLNDQLRHYEAKINSVHAVERDLLEAKQTIKRLTNELENIKNKDKNEKKSDMNAEISENLKSETEQLEQNDNTQNTSTNGTTICLKQKETESVDEKNDLNKKLDKEMAVKYLEDKVTRTMKEIADLSEEKQRLEHIILQLQSETEIIGEYVALYQHQRMVLKQKTLEKDEQVKQLSSDRDQMKVRLDQLSNLINKLVSRNYINQDSVNKLQHQTDDSKPNHEVTDSTEQTVNQINLLLSDIKTSNLMLSDETFHHCPSCSGQLITI